MPSKRIFELADTVLRKCVLPLLVLVSWPAAAEMVTFKGEFQRQQVVAPEAFDPFSDPLTISCAVVTVMVLMWLVAYQKLPVRFAAIVSSPDRKFKYSAFAFVIAPMVAGFALYRCFNLPESDVLGLEELDAHPIAAAVGSVLPTLCLGAVAYLYARLRAKKLNLTTKFIPLDPYQLAGEEILSGDLKPAIWARALADGNGNEQRARSIYIKQRVAEIMGTAAQ